MNQETKNCQNCKKDFVIEPDDFGFYKKMQVPLPTFCPDCRFQRRLLFRNNRVFYRRECALCKKSLLSVYNTERPYVIYCRDCWLSDKWDPIDYGREYDFSIPFFSQFRSLQSKIPRANMYQTNFISSEYCNYGLDFKECYLSFGGHNNERVYFGNQIFDSKVISCEHGGKCKDQCTEAFKIVPEEFKFYKRMSLPLPRLCPNCRHYQRLKLRNPLKLWHRQCMCNKKNHFHGVGKCEIEFKTSYAPERSEIIYCEKCYQQEVY